VNDFEYVAHRPGAGIVGDYQQNPLAGVVIMRKELANRPGRLFVRNKPVSIFS
jgi:hypothetical protein